MLRCSTCFSQLSHRIEKRRDAHLREQSRTRAKTAGQWRRRGERDNQSSARCQEGSPSWSVDLKLKSLLLSSRATPNVRLLLGLLSVGGGRANGASALLSLALIESRPSQLELLPPPSSRIQGNLFFLSERCNFHWIGC